MKELKVGFIGCGGIARVHAARLSTLGEVRLKAFCDVIEEKAVEFSRQYGGNVYTDWETMMAGEALDIVYVCLPPSRTRMRLWSPLRKASTSSSRSP